MKIGIYMTARKQTGGGGYTITYDLLNALIKKINNYKNHSFYFILVNDKNNFIKKKLNLNKIQFTEFNESKIILIIKNLLFSIFPTLLFIYRYFKLDKFYNLEKNLKLDVIWYLSAEYTYPRFENYISTIWDLMHITDTRFPEVGNFFVRNYRNIVIKIFLLKSKKIITGSNYTINILKKNFKIKLNKVIKSKHPTPSIFLNFKKTKKNNEFGKFFLYPANFWQHKNHINLIKAFNLFNINEKFRYNLVLVGDKKNEDYYNKIIKLISSIDSRNNIFLLNFVSTKKLVNLYDSCISLVYSSYCGPENLPPLEAYARNKPVICSLYEGAKEQLENFPIYFKPDNIASISKSFKNLLDNKDKKNYNYLKFAKSKNSDDYITKVLSNVIFDKEFNKNIFVLGINGGNHGDSSACLVKNGRLIAAVEEERFLKIKQSSNFPVNSIKYCLKNANIRINDVNYIAINNNFYANFFSKLKYFFTNFDASLNYIRRKMNNFKNQSIKEKFKIHFRTNVSKKLFHISHHLSHAFSTFFFLKKNINSLIYSFDGSGDFSTIEIYLLQKSKIKLIEKTLYPNSLGFFYTTFSQFLGFVSYGEEYKFMGLSAYGRPIYTNLIKKLFISEDPLKINMKYFNQPQIYISDNVSPKVNLLYSKNFIDLFGNPLKRGEEIKQIYKDYAASAQKVFEDIVLKHLIRLKKQHKCDKLYLTGGCALNGLLVGKIIKLKLFKEVEVGPNPGDSGCGVGSAFNLLYKKNLHISSHEPDIALGPSYSNEYIKKNIINKINDKKNYEIKFYKNFDFLISRTAKIIGREKIVFWYQDKIEWGPRALGNRSILADPRDKKIIDIINAKVKKREMFRPFAPSIIKDFAKDYFFMHNKTESKYMNIVFDAKNLTKKNYPGIVHVDGTSRVQTVSKENNVKFYKLLKEFKKITNCPMILNTSLNINNPISLKPIDAFDCFLKTDIKTIILNNWLIKKK